jgi:hypothetical protein
MGAGALATAPQITYGQSRRVFAPALSRLDSTDGAPNAYFGPNFQFVATPVPEPTTALFGLALLGITAAGRWRRA